MFDEYPVGQPHKVTVPPSARTLDQLVDERRDQRRQAKERAIQALKDRICAILGDDIYHSLQGVRVVTHEYCFGLTFERKGSSYMLTSRGNGVPTHLSRIRHTFDQKVEVEEELGTVRNLDTLVNLLAAEEQV